MEFRRVSSTGMVTSAIGLGCLALTGAYGAADSAESMRTVRMALDMGIQLIVLADHYGGGATERLVGRAVAGRRDEALIATEGGTRFGEGRRARVDGSPAHLRRACDASLRRLHADHIDLYFLARVDPHVPITESVGAMAELVRAGKVRHIGLPAVPRTVLRQAYAEHPITAVAGEYSLWHRDAESELLPAAQELGVGFLACRPLGRGFMTGRITSTEQLTPDDPRHDDPRFQGENFRRNRLLLRVAEEIASHYDIGVGRLALRWLLAQGDEVVPVPGTRKVAHAEMNAAAVGVWLGPRERRLLEDTFPVGAAAGAAEWRRYEASLLHGQP